MSPYDFVSILIVIGIVVVFIRRQRADRRPRPRSNRWINQGDDGSVTPMTSGALEPRFERGAHRRSDNDGGDGGYPTGGGPGPSHSHGHTGSWGDGHGGGDSGGGGDGGGGGGGD